MAIILLGPTIADARGALGNAVFSRGPAGSTLAVRPRARPASVQPHSDRSFFLQASQYWEWSTGLAYHTAWVNAAASVWFTNKIGTRYHPSGRSLFLRHAIAAREIGFTGFGFPPPDPMTVATCNPVITFDAVHHRLSLTIPYVTFPIASTYWFRISFAQSRYAKGSWPRSPYTAPLIVRNTVGGLGPYYFYPQYDTPLGPYIWTSIRTICYTWGLSPYLLTKTLITDYH